MSDQSLTVFSTLSHGLRRAYDAIADAADMLFNAGPRIAELRHLVATSEDDLRARGLTRATELERILGRR